MRRWQWTAVLGFVGLLGGCGGSSPPPTPPAPAPQAGAPVVTPKEPEVKPPAPVSYEAKGRRDPFQPPTTGIQSKEGGLAVASMKLVGILQGRQGPMALVEGPDGLGYILRPGELIGDGRVAEIGLESVTFSVTGRPGQPPTRTVLKLKTDVAGGKP